MEVCALETGYSALPPPGDRRLALLGTQGHGHTDAGGQGGGVDCPAPGPRPIPKARGSRVGMDGLFMEANPSAPLLLPVTGAAG